ncbi:MAG: hypothetical protein M1831_000194 [Alyxoria varia]|nr:MAG: hypothetical protein M1831_000194 [Alyxoria varia]
MAPHAEPEEPDQTADILDADEAGEEIQQDDDVPMDSGDEEDEAQDAGEIVLQNDSVAHFDAHNDSIFCIGQHPLHSDIVATGAGDDKGYVFSTSQSQPGYQTPQTGHNNGNEMIERPSLPAISQLQGHTDSIIAIAFTLPHGEYLVTGGLDGQIRAYRDSKFRETSSASTSPPQYEFLTSAREVDEINFLLPCPSASHSNTFALGASDGSVWVYAIDSAAESSNSLQILSAFYLHTASATAGAWTSDGSILATVSEDGSFYAWDVFGDAAATGIVSPGAGGGQYVVGLTGEDERFRVEGGLYSVAISPNGAIAAVGGAEGHIRVIGLPRLDQTSNAMGGVQSGAGAKNKPGGAKLAHGPKSGGPNASTTASGVSGGQAGQILASLQSQSDSVETIAFSPSSDVPLMAAGSVDGSVVLFDTARNFAVRRRIDDAHEEQQAVIKVEFVGTSWILTSCGNDGVVRRWDTRGGHSAGPALAPRLPPGAAASITSGGQVGASEMSPQGCIGQWRGHRGGGEGGGVMGFAQGGEHGRYIVTAGDDSISLVFDTMSTLAAA